MGKHRQRTSVTPPERPEKIIPNKRKSQKSKAQRSESIQRPDTILWQGWKDIFLCGTEWANLNQVHNNPWDFTHLKDFLRNEEKFKEEFSDVNNIDRVLLFGGTEAQSLPDASVVLVPFIVASVGDIPFPENVGVTSVQRVGESILPMSEFKLDWTPMDFSLRKHNTPRTYYIHCSKRQTVVKNMKEEDVVEYNYVIPHILAPRVCLKDEDPPTNINLRVDDFHGKAIQLAYDWEVDSLKQYVMDMCEQYGLDFSKVGKEMRDIILEEKKKVLDQFRTEQDERKQKFYDLPNKVQEQLKNVRFVKFYPQNPEVQAFKSPLINRYYGKADHVL